MAIEKINAKVFLTVARTGSFRKAADLLGYTQAGISYIINSMEEETGLSLFVRDHNGVRLSEEGKELEPQMEQLEIWQRHFEQTVGELNGLRRGNLRVLIFDSISVHWIPGIVRRFREDFPGISLELISEESAPRQEELVRSGAVDCGFFFTRIRSQDITYYPLLEENVCALVPANHPLARLERFPVSELGKHPFIEMKFADRSSMGDVFARTKTRPQTVFRMDNDYAAMAMVREGIGFCVFPELLLRDMPQGVRSMQFDQPMKRTIGIGTATRSKACQKFIEYTRQWVRENYPSGDDQ